MTTEALQIATLTESEKRLLRDRDAWFVRQNFDNVYGVAYVRGETHSEPFGIFVPSANVFGTAKSEKRVRKLLAQYADEDGWRGGRLIAFRISDLRAA